jgi:hypothetical protein
MFLVTKLNLYMFRPKIDHHRKVINTSKEILHMYYMHAVMYELH